MNESMRNIVYPGKPLLGCNIKKGMKMDECLEIICAGLELVHNGQSLDCLDLQKYGITCPPDKKTGFLCWMMERILDAQGVLANRIAAINAFLAQYQQVAGMVADERVKVTAASQQAKYLLQCFSGTPGRIKYDQANDRIVVTGLTPIGARMAISPARLADFDANGKGKVNTDVEGWAIRDGRNGLDNALGAVMKYTDTLQNAGQRGGSNNMVVQLGNVASFSIALSGGIAGNLLTPYIIQTPMTSKTKNFPTFGGIPDTVLQAPLGGPGNTTLDSLPLNVAHDHWHTLALAHNNPNPTPITINPEHVKEVPIEFIGI